MHDLLRHIIAIPAFSGDEGARADFVASYLEGAGMSVERVANNVFTRVKCGGNGAKTLMLNSHLDTVRPAAGYTFDPFLPPTDPNIIYGLGSNDAGVSVVAMIATALYFARHGGLDYDLLLLLSAEEETSGKNGMSLVINRLGEVDCAIVGEPTGMRAAIAERGLLVLDGVAGGVSGHAARGDGDNAIYRAIRDIEALRGHKFTKNSPLMGLPTLAVTQINAGTQHNVVPDRCTFVVDIRPTDVYANDQILSELEAITESILVPRSLKNCSSATPVGHPLIETARRLEIETYISPTTSDWMRLGTIPAIKMGPGDSSRSHTADEYITVRELDEGVAGYINFLSNMVF